MHGKDAVTQMKLRNLLEGIEISDCTEGALDCEISGISEDSREDLTGKAFICLVGEHSDGHDYVGEAVKKGAAVLICERLPLGYESYPYVITPSTRKADAWMWSRFYGDPASELKVIAVTGTNGKTSITYMLKSMLEEMGKKVGVIGTIRNMIGDLEVESTMTTPLPKQLYGLIARMRDAGVEYLVMEASSHALDFEKLAAITPEIGIFTNLTPDHLDYHENMGNYAKAKAKLFKISKISVINADDSYGKYMYEQATGKKYYYSRDSRYADFTAQNIENHGIRGSEYDLISENEAIHIECSIPGAFSVSNSLAAAVAARLCGASCKDVALAMRRLQGVSGRMETVPLGGDFTVIIDYAHTPDALENVLKTIRAFKTPAQRLVAVFGCGGDRDKTKRPVMGNIATAMADFTVITSDNSRTENPAAIIEDILRGVSEGSNYKVIENRTEALNWVVKNARKDDIILVAGKGHENYEITAAGKHPFSEKEIIRKAFSER